MATCVCNGIRLDIAIAYITLFLSGFFAIWMYASTLAYLADANAGRSYSAVALDGSFRGTLAFVATETSDPVQEVLGVGGMYTAFAGVLIIVELLIPLVMCGGLSCREEREQPKLNTGPGG
ncbi:hypothetical protein ID866_7002 [Astraeus odoratus]|nr:hypothetical protein ID866_7002 [Astraeus odoratus]